MRWNVKKIVSLFLCLIVLSLLFFDPVFLLFKTMNTIIIQSILDTYSISAVRNLSGCSGLMLILCFSILGLDNPIKMKQFSSSILKKMMIAILKEIRDWRENPLFFSLKFAICLFGGFIFISWFYLMLILLFVPIWIIANGFMLYKK